ncbi:MAG: phosphate transport system regulatory protein PhoU [Lachnospiraceae bacterium]|nr:phosphate transport system regulatory protein PhoU [Lachnospiraceae bacterium]
MRTAFEEELKQLKNDVLTMSSGILRSYGALRKAAAEGDRATLEQIVGGDSGTGLTERRIEDRCMSLIISQQPVAGDLRFITASLKMVTDLERVAHHLADIAELVIRLRCVDTAGYSGHLDKMAARAGESFSSAVSAFLTGRTDEARQVVEGDDEIDALFNEVKDDLVRKLRQPDAGRQKGGEDETDGGTCDADVADVCVDLLMIAKYLEKIGDHAVNIAEWGIFQETGEMTHIM